MDRQQRDFPLELKAAREDGTFTGSLSVYNVKDEYGDIVLPGAFDVSLKASGGSVPLLWQHRVDEPIGSLSLRDTEAALLAEGRLLLSVPRAREAYDFLKAGVVRGLSIGFRTVRDEVINNVRRLLEVKLYEGSLVTIPANPEATVTAVKSAFAGASVRDYEAWLRQAGQFSKSQAKALAAGGWRALEGAPSDEEHELLEWLQSANARFQRRY